MEFLYGALGMIAVLLVFAAGAVVGWKAKERVNTAKTEIKMEALSEKEAAELKQEEQAFSAMIGYNIDMAYGIDKVLSADDGG